MTRGRKVLLVCAIVGLVALVATWGAIYAFAYQGVKVTPAKSVSLSTSSPVISAAWPYAIGARLLASKVFIDGKDISELVEPVSNGFAYSPENLPEGGHVVKARLTYWWLFKRRVDLRWYFTTDTVPPEIAFSHSSPMIAVPRSWIHDLEGSTEPGSEIKVSLNGRALSSPVVDETGHFSVSLYQLADKNEFKVDAIDQAGNETSVVIPVVIDRAPPSVMSLSPGDGETMHSEKVSVLAEFEEKDSRIDSSVLRIDNIQVYGDFNFDKNELTYSSKFLSHGKHEAVLEVVDAAGNSLQKKWTFEIDTTRLVLSLSQKRISLYRDGALVKTYPCAIGRADFPTPKGHWKVVGKRKNPSWHNPHSGWSASMPAVIPPGPGNPLGTRAIELNAPAIRIHGTPNPGSVGHAASHGCIRMYKHDVEELFDIVTIGVPVDIVS